MKIWIADNSTFFAKYLEMIIPRIAGVEAVESCRYADMSIHDLEIWKPDVLVIDNCQDGHCDTHLIQQLRERMPDITVIVYLPSEYEFFGEPCHLAGAEHVISKSSGTEYLRYIIRELLHRIQRNREGVTENYALADTSIDTTGDSKLDLGANTHDKTAEEASSKATPDGMHKFWKGQKGLSISKRNKK